MKNKTVCFTGHREIRDDSLKERLEALLIELIEDGYEEFLAGGARGFDMMAADVVLALKKTYPHIKLILYLPFFNQYRAESGWSEEEKADYHVQKLLADEALHVAKEYRRGIYYERNRLLVDNASLCVAYLYKSTGGTAYTVDYAKRRNMKIINIAI